MTSELWTVASATQVRETIARCREDARAREALGNDFAPTYTSFSGGVTGYWNRYLTWIVVQTLAIERWPHLTYSLRDAATLVLRYLDEPAEEDNSGRNPLKRWLIRPRSTREAVPQVAATMQLLATLGGTAAEARADALSPGVDPKYTEEGALYLDDSDCERILAALPALRTFFIDPPYGPRFHFWIVRQPGLPRPVRDALRLPNQFLGDIEMIFTRARDTHAQVFILWAP